MNKVEFGDYYRFVTSLGLSLIAGAVVLPWLVLRESPPFVTMKELDQGAPVEARASLARWEQYSCLLGNWWIGSLILFAVGTYLLVDGMAVWRRRQETDDDRETQKHLKAMGEETPAETAQNALEEVKESLENEPKATAVQVLQTAMDRLDTGHRVVEKIRAAFPNAHLLANQRLGNSRLDAVIRATRGNVLFEVKALVQGVPIVSQAVENQMRHLRNQGRLALGPPVSSVLVLVLPDGVTLDLTQSVPLQEMSKGCYLTSHGVGVVVLAESEIDGLSDSAFREFVERLWPRLHFPDEA